MLPEIELFDFNSLWEFGGPFIITAIVIIVFALISLIFLSSINKGLVKEIIRIGIIVGLIVVTLASFQITSYLWSL